MNTDTAVFAGTFQTNEDGEGNTGPLGVPGTALETDVVGVFGAELAQ